MLERDGEGGNTLGPGRGGPNGTGILDGCAVTEWASPDLAWDATLSRTECRLPTAAQQQAGARHQVSRVDWAASARMMRHTQVPNDDESLGMFCYQPKGKEAVR